MKIDLRGGSQRQDGFGVAGRTIKRTLESLGHEIDPDAEISFLFTHPHHFIAEAEYNIGYFPWESTEPVNGWRRNMRKMDEIWVTSPVMVDYVREWGFDPYVYQHGLNPTWRPKRRKVDGRLTFLHQGLEAYRKGGHDAMSAFHAAFPGRNDVQLVMKTSSSNISIDTGRMRTDGTLYDEPGLRNLYYNSHVMLAPSYGEGFGLPAFDAIGTAMPTIMTKDVFPHEDYVNKNLLIKSEKVESLWEDTHPGLMWQPDFDDLVDRMRFVADNYEVIADEAYDFACKAHEEASWKVRTKKAFGDLALRMNA